MLSDYITMEAIAINGANTAYDEFLIAERRVGALHEKMAERGLSFPKRGLPVGWTDIKKAGAIAFNNGESVDDNPYSIPSERAYWFDGFFSEKWSPRCENTPREQAQCELEPGLEVP